MEQTDAGTSVGVADPYAHVDRCDHLTDDGRCRFAVERGDRDPDFARERRAEDFACPVVAQAADDEATGSVDAAELDWQRCEHFCCRHRDRECRRCGLEEVRVAHSAERPLLEEHHLSYDADSSAGEGEPSHEITVYLCRWCHTKVHKSWAAIEDDVGPDPEAIAAREERRGREQRELGFEAASDRFGEDSSE